MDPSVFCEPGDVDCLGVRMRVLSALEDVTPENLGQRIVLLTYGMTSGLVSGLNAGRSAGGGDLFERIRRSLYRLCDSSLRPYCAATQRPYPLRDSPEARESARNAAGRPSSVSLAVVDVGALVVGPGEPSPLVPGGQALAVTALMSRLLACRPALVIVCSDSPEHLEAVYGAHAQAVAGVLPLIMLSSRMNLAAASASLGAKRSQCLQMLRTWAEPLQAGRAMLQLGVQRERNTQDDYEQALQYGVWVVEYLSLMGCWRNALNGREVSALEHVHDHLDKVSALGWQKEAQGLQVAFSLDVLSDQWNLGVADASPFGCSLQELGSVLTYLGRTGLCRVLHIISANQAIAGVDRSAEIIATLIYKLIVLREEYSES